MVLTLYQGLEAKHPVIRSATDDGAGVCSFFVCPHFRKRVVCGAVCSVLPLLLQEYLVDVNGKFVRERLQVGERCCERRLHPVVRVALTNVRGNDRRPGAVQGMRFDEHVSWRAVHGRVGILIADTGGISLRLVHLSRIPLVYLRHLNIRIGYLSVGFFVDALCIIFQVVDIAGGVTGGVEQEREIYVSGISDYTEYL